MVDKGVTDTENALINLCKRIFSDVFIYANPYKNDRTAKEVCDVLVIFDRHIIVFFDRHREIKSNTDEKTTLVDWSRWLQKSINAQITTVNGVERWFRDNSSGNRLFTDKSFTQEIILPADMQSVQIHKIIIAHGSEEACSDYYSDYYGSLIISYSAKGEQFDFNAPFYVSLDNNDPVHIFDSSNLRIIMDYLNTPDDFIRYLVTKEDYIRTHDWISYSGEEDLLAHYLRNTNKDNHHYIGDEKDYHLAITSGLWKDFIDAKVYESTKKANEISCFWDNLINIVIDKSVYQYDYSKDLKEFVFLMLQPNRMMRRIYSEKIVQRIINFPKACLRNLIFLQSENGNSAYVVILFPFMPSQLQYGNMNEYVEFRSIMLKTACIIAISRYSYLENIIGVALDPFNCSDSPPGILFVKFSSASLSQSEIEEAIDNNESFNFFVTGREEKIYNREFVH